MSSLLSENLSAIVHEAFALPPSAGALLVFDLDCPLSRALTQAYTEVLPELRTLDFHTTSVPEIRGAIDALAPGDLVILVQSSSFRLNEFRFRLELFDRKLQVIEHTHLARMKPEEEGTYIESLAYDPSYYRVIGPAVKQRLDQATRTVVRGVQTELIYETPFEEAKLNIGDYAQMKNKGGQFPIGEVFTEAKDFRGVHGTAALFAFGGRNFDVVVPKEPILIDIEESKIVGCRNAPADFQSILDEIRAQEPVWVREFGCGMNRAMTRERLVSDIGSYERMCGIHLSLGQKHTVYTKTGFPKRTSRFHVDVFVDVSEVLVDGQVLYQDGKYLV